MSRPVFILTVLFAIVSLATAPIVTPVYGAPLLLDQFNDPIWTGAASNMQPANQVGQSFVPTLPRLLAVDVNMMTGNPGKGGDTLTMSIIGDIGQTLTSTSQFVAEGFDGFLRFDIPGDGIGVTPGQDLIIRLEDTGKIVFFWRYQGGNPYPQGTGLFSGSQFEDNDFLFKTFGTVPEPPTLALVDIKPGSDFNSVNLKSRGGLSVAILSTVEFNVNEVDIDTLMFGDPLLIDNGGAAVRPLRSAYEDVSGDGLLDLTLKFSTADLVEAEALGPNTLEGLLTGFLRDGTPFEGMDSIRIVPPNGSNGNSLQVRANPEPSTLALTALGLLGIGWRRRKRA